MSAGENGQQVLLVTVPTFSTTQTACLINLRDLSCQPTPSLASGLRTMMGTWRSSTDGASMDSINPPEHSSAYHLCVIPGCPPGSTGTEPVVAKERCFYQYNLIYLCNKKLCGGPWGCACLRWALPWRAGPTLPTPLGWDGVRAVSQGWGSASLGAGPGAWHGGCSAATQPWGEQQHSPRKQRG